MSSLRQKYMDKKKSFQNDSSSNNTSSQLTSTRTVTNRRENKFPITVQSQNTFPKKEVGTKSKILIKTENRIVTEDPKNTNQQKITNRNRVQRYQEKLEIKTSNENPNTTTTTKTHTRVFSGPAETGTVVSRYTKKTVISSQEEPKKTEEIVVRGRYAKNKNEKIQGQERTGRTLTIGVNSDNGAPIENLKEAKTLQEKNFHRVRRGNRLNNENNNEVGNNKVNKEENNINDEQKGISNIEKNESSNVTVTRYQRKKIAQNETNTTNNNNTQNSTEINIKKSINTTETTSGKIITTQQTTTTTTKTTTTTPLNDNNENITTELKTYRQIKTPALKNTRSSNTEQNKQPSKNEAPKKVRMIDNRDENKLLMKNFSDFNSEPNNSNLRKSGDIIDLSKEIIKPRPKSPDPVGLLRKSFNRGENIQITHIIYMKNKPTKFNIKESLSNKELLTKPLNLEENRIKLSKSPKRGEITCSSSCDNVRIRPYSPNLKGKITVFQHCQGIGMTNLDPKENRSKLYTSNIIQIPIIKKVKMQPKIEYVETFRTNNNNEKNSTTKKFNFKLKTMRREPENNIKSHEEYYSKVKISSRKNLSPSPTQNKITDNKLVIKESGREKIFVTKSDIKRCFESYTDEPEAKRTLRHYLMKFKNITKKLNEIEPITNIKYVSWFYRNCNDNNIPQLNNQNNFNDFIEKNEIDTMINLINKQKNLVEEMPYDEWFNRHCVKRIGEKKYEFIRANTVKIPDNVLKILKSLEKIQKQKTDKDNNLYTETEYKTIEEAVNKLPINEQKIAVITLTNNENNEEKKKQLNKLHGMVENNLKTECINKVIERYNNQEKKEKLKNLVNLWNQEPKIPKDTLINNEDFNKMEEKEKTEHLKKINTLFNDKDYKTKDSSKNILINHLQNLDNKNQEEAILYLKKNNNTKTKENEINKIKSMVTCNKRKLFLSKLLGGSFNNTFSENNENNNENERIKKIISLFGELDDGAKTNMLKYMKDTTGNNDSKTKDLEEIIQNLTPIKLKKDSVISINDDSKVIPDYSLEQITFELNPNEYSESEDSKKAEYFNSISEDIPVSDDNIFDTDELYDIVAEVENEENNNKKQLADDEFSNVVDELKTNLYIENDNSKMKKKMEEEEEILNKVENKLRALNKKDQTRAMDIIKKYADNKKKKEIFDKFEKKIKKLNGLRNMVKNFLDSLKKEQNDQQLYNNNQNNKKEEIDLVSQNIISELFPSNIEKENSNIILEQNKIDNAADKISNFSKTDQVKIINNIRPIAKTSEQINILKKLNTLIEEKNKLNKISYKIKRNNSINIPNNILIEEKNTKRLSKDELELLTEKFVDDLFKENDEPKTRAEKRDIDLENEEKLKKVAKTINDLNRNDQLLVFAKLKKFADNDKKREKVKAASNLSNAMNNFKIYINKLILGQIQQEENKKKEKTELTDGELNELTDKFVDDIFPKYENAENINTMKSKVEDHIIEKINEDKLNKIAEILKDLNEKQKKKVLDTLKKSSEKEKEPGKYMNLIKKLKKYEKMKEIIEKLTNVKKVQLKHSKTLPLPVIKNENNKNNSTTKKNKTKTKNLNENEMTELSEGIISDIFPNNNNKVITFNVADEYINEKNKKDKFNNVVNVMKNLQPKDQENIMYILDANADNVEKKQLLRKLSLEIKPQTENNQTNVVTLKENLKNSKLNEPIKNFEEEQKELTDDQLGELTEGFISDLFKDYSIIENDNKKIEENKINQLNKVANIIKNLHKRDQEKVKKFLKENAKNPEQQNQVEKLNRLVNNMNGLKLYLRNIIKDRLNQDSQNNELPKTELNKIADDMVKNLYKENDTTISNTETPILSIEEKINNNSNKIIKLNEKDQNTILEILKKNAKDEENQNIFKKIRDAVRFKNRAKIIGDIKIKSNDDKKKEKLSNEELDDLTNIYLGDLFEEEQIPKNSTEDLLLKENQENKIKEVAESIKKLNPDDQEKTLKVIEEKAIDDNQKEKAKKLSNLVTNLNNMKSYFGKMLKDNLHLGTSNQKVIEQSQPLEGDFHHEEIEILANRFGDDIYKNNNTPDSINTVANLIKELNPKDQEKAMFILKTRAKNENAITPYNDLETRLANLNNLKNKIQTFSYKFTVRTHNIQKIVNGQVVEEHYEIEELPVESLNKIIESFTIELFEDDENDDVKIQNMSYTIMQLNPNDQQKILDEIQNKAKNDKEKEKINELINKVNENKKMDDIAKNVKEKLLQKNNEQNEKSIALVNYYNNNDNLGNKEINKYTTEFANDLFIESPKKSSNKTQEYLESKKSEEKLNNMANIINNFSEEDKETTFEILNKKANTKEKLSNLQKLAKIVNNLNKVNIFVQKLKSKALARIEEEKNEDENSFTDEELQKNANQFNNEILSSLRNSQLSENEKEENLNNIAQEISKIQPEQQTIILNTMKNDVSEDDHKEQILKLIQLVNNKNQLKSFANKVKEKQAQKKVEEQIKNEENYGIFISSPEENAPIEIIIQSKQEMDEADLQELIDAFNSELYGGDLHIIVGNEKIDGVEKYNKEKEMENKLINISKVLNHLNEKDKEKAMNNLNIKADNSVKKSIYEKLKKMVDKTIKTQEKEKIIAQKEVAKEIEEKNKNNPYDNLVKTIKDGITLGKDKFENE